MKNMRRDNIIKSRKDVTQNKIIIYCIIGIGILTMILARFTYI